MKWRIYSLFNSVRVECEECGHYVTADTEKHALAQLKKQKINCP